MSTPVQVGMNLDDFISASHGESFELINGEKRLKMSGLAGHNYIMHLMYQAIFRFLLNSPLGEIFMEVTFVLPNAYDSNWVKDSRIPDLAFFEKEKLADYRQKNSDWLKKPYLLIPDLVIEIVSPHDRVSELDEKIDAYLADGVQTVWVINPQRQKAIVHALKHQPIHLGREDTLEGGVVLPDFQLNLADIFAELSE